MHKQTLKIEELANVPEHERKNYVAIPDDQLETVRGMNRKQRRAWLAEQRRLQKRQRKERA